MNYFNDICIEMLWHILSFVSIESMARLLDSGLLLMKENIGFYVFNRLDSLKRVNKHPILNQIEVSTVRAFGILGI